MNAYWQALGSLLGWTFVGWVAVCALILALQAGRKRKSGQRAFVARQAELRRRIEAAAQAAHAARSIPAWEGWRAFRVAAIVEEARNVKSFYLTPRDGRPLATFLPGQYLTFRLPLPDGPPLVRCYSLSDRPREDYFRVTVKRIGPPAERPDGPTGRGSGYLHDRVAVGDVLEARAPAGTFFIDPHAREPIVLVGGGIGVTPLMSMLEAIVHAGRRRDVLVLLGFRNGREQPFRERLRTLAQEHPHVRLHVSYSSPRSEDVLYRDFGHRGRLTIERLREVLPSSNFAFYVCGPGPMMESLVPALWAWGVPESHVRFEAFGPASVKRVCGASAGQATVLPCTVRFARSGRDVNWDGKFDSLLEMGEAAGVTLPSGCRAGSCGECLTAVRSGRVRPLKAPGFPVPDAHCLTCISVPMGELVLDA